MTKAVFDDAVENDFICPSCKIQLNSDGTCSSCLSEDPNDDDVNFYRANPTSHPDYEPCDDGDDR